VEEMKTLDEYRRIYPHLTIRGNADGRWLIVGCWGRATLYQSQQFAESELRNRCCGGCDPEKHHIVELSPPVRITPKFRVKTYHEKE